MAGLAVTAALLSYVTQRYVVAPNTVLDGMPEAMVTAQRMMPALSAVGLLVAGGVVPVALLVYWVVSSTLDARSVGGDRAVVPHARDGGALRRA